MGRTELLMKIIVDIDQTICDRPEEAGGDYSKSYPLKDRIEKINALYDEGHEIHYWTARGTVTGINWYMVTFEQLKTWGCKFHTFKVGKPDYDLFICDKAINSDTFFNK
jgi:hypothetical protein